MKGGENAPIYDNLYCPICGKRIMTAVNCQRYRGLVHMEHCEKCSYFLPIFWHCKYYFEHMKSARR